jgi:hypothetical protein
MCVELGTKVAEVALEIAVHPAGRLIRSWCCCVQEYHWYLKLGFPAQTPGDTVNRCPEAAEPERIGETKLATFAITIGDDAE